MKNVLLFGFQLLCVAALATGCAPKTTVPALDSNLQNQVNQNLANGSVPSPQAVSSGSVTEAPSACDAFRKRLPADWFQGMLEVPENPAEPEGLKTHVFYYGKRGKGTPTIFFNGGPGADSHGTSRKVISLSKIFDPSGDLYPVFIDQRGNGCSDFYPQGSDPETLARLTHYGSRGIVADAEAVRSQLIGTSPWIAFGQSYGGFIVHRYTTVAPDSLKAAFANEGVITSDGYGRIKQRIAAQVRVMKEYLARYPEDRDRFAALKTYLVPERCYTNDKATQSACGAEVLSTFSDSLLGFTSDWPDIHLWIGAMVPASGVSDGAIQLFLATFSFNESNPLNIKGWASRVIGWADRDVRSMDSYQCVKIRTDLMAEGINLDEEYSHECMSGLLHAKPDSTDSSLRYQQLPQDLLKISDLAAALTSHSSLAFYLYSGQLDSYVPVENFAEELAAVSALPNVHYTNFTSSGHNAYFDEPKVWQELMDETKRP